jgi:hypothetical protein
MGVRAVTVNAALDELQRCQGTQFDSGVVEGFHDCLLRHAFTDVTVGTDD